MATYSSNTTLANGSNPTRKIRVVDAIEEITADNVTVQVPADPDGNRRDYVLACQTVGVTSGGGSNSRWLLDDCTIMMDTANNHRFKQGFISAKRSKILLMENVRLVWPANAINNAGNGFTFDFEDAYIACPVSVTGTNGFVFHLGGADANGGTLNTNRITFGPNVVPQNIPHIAWVNTTFSNSSSEAASGSGENNYFRFVDADAGMATLEWSGLFGCDLSAWVNVSNETEHFIGSLALPWEDDLGSVPTAFVLNCSYASGINDQKIYNTSGPVGREVRWVSGRAWKPSFSLPDGTATSTNYKLDFGAFDVYEMQATRDQDTTPTLVTQSAGSNVNNFRTDGWAIVEESVIASIASTSQGNASNFTTRLDVNIAEKNVTVYSYEDETWNTSGVAQTVTTVASPFSDALVLGDTENYVFAATAQTSITKANAELLRAGTNSIVTLDDLVAAVRKDGFDNTNDLIFYSSDPSTGAVVIPNNVILSDNGSTLSVAPSTTAGNFGALGAGTQYTTLTGNVELNANMPTLGTGLTVDGDLTINSAMDLTDLTVTGNLRIATGANSTLNFSNVAVQGNVFNDSSANTLTINGSNGSSLPTTEAGTGNGQVNIVNAVTVSVTVVDTDGSTIENVRVYCEAGTGGPETQGTVILNGLTNASGIFEITTFNYVSDQPIQNGRARAASGSPYYKAGTFAGTITSSGFSTTVTLILDE